MPTRLSPRMSPSPVAMVGSNGIAGPPSSPGIMPVRSMTSFWICVLSRSRAPSAMASSIISLRISFNFCSGNSSPKVLRAPSRDSNPICIFIWISLSKTSLSRGSGCGKCTVDV